MRTKIVEQDISYIVNADLPWHDLEHQTILISGASGFLASFLVDVFAYLNETKKLNIKIIALYRNKVKISSRFNYLSEKHQVTFIQHDVCQPLSIDRDIDIVIHTASYASPKIFDNNPVGTILPNTIGTKNLLDLAVEKKVKAFLFFSTSGVYGFHPPENYPLHENQFGELDPTLPSSCYLESKRMGENFCIAWYEQLGVPIKIVRPAITYGPGVDIEGGRSFEDFINCIIKHKDISLYSDGSAIRNYCYLADATLGFLIVLLKGKVGEAYNVSTDHEISIKELAEYLVDSVFPERNLSVNFYQKASKNYLRTQFSRTTVDITKVKELGWRLSYPIKEGFRRVILDLEERMSQHTK